MLVTQSTTNLILMIGAGIGVFVLLLMAGPKRLYIPYFLMLLLFLMCDVHLLRPYRELLLQLRWIVLPATGAFLVFQLRTHNVRLHVDILTLLFVLLLGVAAGTAAISSSDPKITLLKTATLGALFFTIFLGVRSYLHAMPTAIHRLADGYAYTAVLVVVSSLFYFAFWREKALLAGWLRGYFSNPNFLGVVLIVFAPFLAFKYLNPYGERRKLFFWAVYAAATVLLILTRSRSCMAAYLIALFTLLLIFNRRYLPLLFLLGALSFGFSYLTGTGALTLEGRSSVVQAYVFKQRASILGGKRAEIQKILLENIRHNFWFGVGFGISPSLADDPYGLDLEVGYLQKREKGNSYLAIQEELGVLGSVLTLTILVLVLYRALRSIRLATAGMRANNPDVVMLLVFFTNIVGLLFNAGFEAWMLAAGNVICLIFWTNLLAMNHLSQLVWEKVLEERRAALQMAAGITPAPIPAAVPAAPTPVPIPRPAAARPTQAPRTGFTY